MEDLESPLDADLLDALALDRLVPDSLARWRPLVSEGLLFFLDRLPPEHLEEIVAAQFALALDTDPHQRVVTLLAQCPTLHKLGQVVARDRRLDAGLRARLQTLESLPAVTPMAAVRSRIRAELPPDAPVTLADEALAEASVAVVVPFTWQADGATHEGVFKVLKPGVETRLHQELAIWSELAEHLEVHAARLGLPALDYRDTLDSVRELLAREVRLEVEQENLRAAAAFYADEPRVQIPAPLPWCTPRMTAMQRVHGVKLTDAPPASRRALAGIAIDALLGRPFWSDAPAAVIHADPHAGNLFATLDGRLAVLDWSLTARLDKARREAVVQAVLGALTLDAGRIRQSVAGLGSLDPDNPHLLAAVERALDRVPSAGRRRHRRAGRAERVQRSVRSWARHRARRFPRRDRPGCR